MDGLEFIELSKIKVAEAANRVQPDFYSYEPDDIYVVWSSKVLQNNKGLFSTPGNDGLYFEVTYNGYENELYVDTYKKHENNVFFFH